MPKYSSNNPERQLLELFLRDLKKTDPDSPWIAMISSTLNRKTARELAAERKERVRKERRVAKFLADPGELVED